MNYMVINNDFSIYDKFPLIIENSYKELCLLNNKRNFSKSYKEIKIDNCLDNIKILKRIKPIHKNNNKKKSKSLSETEKNYNSIYKNDSIINLNLKDEQFNIIKDNKINSKGINNDINISYNENNNSINSLNKSCNFNNNIKIKKNNKMIFTNKYSVKYKKIEKSIKNILIYLVELPP